MEALTVKQKSLSSEVNKRPLSNGLILAALQGLTIQRRQNKEESWVDIPSQEEAVYEIANRSVFETRKYFRVKPKLNFRLPEFITFTGVDSFLKSQDLEDMMR